MLLEQAFPARNRNSASAWGDGAEGYLFLVSIDRRTLALKLRPLLSGVPKYSGAMISDFERGILWVALWPGSIYLVPMAKLHELIRSGGTAPFLSFATEKFHGIEGMSIFMLGNANSLLFYNSPCAYPAFT